MLKEFLTEITLLSLLRLLTDILLPEGESGKYADLGVGLLMLICLLRAVMKLVGGL